MLEIKQVESTGEIEATRAIFHQYEAWLGMSLCFQGFEEEIAGLPGKYAPPNGRLYLARLDGEIVGCIALRPFGERICEMKRLFLREAARGRGAGVALIEKVISDAREIGYERMRLDTPPPKMGKAVSLYEARGFYSIPPYYHNPHNGVLFMEKML